VLYCAITMLLCALAQTVAAENDPKDRHDRIDFVFAGRGIKVTSAAIVGERSDRAEILIKPYPSDHRAVVATVTWE
jgi:hypothetical protein